MEVKGIQQHDPGAFRRVSVLHCGTQLWPLLTDIYPHTLFKYGWSHEGGFNFVSWEYAWCFIQALKKFLDYCVMGKSNGFSDGYTAKEI